MLAARCTITRREETMTGPPTERQDRIPIHKLGELRLGGTDGAVILEPSQLAALVEAAEAARVFLKTGSLTAEMRLADKLSRFDFGDTP